MARDSGYAPCTLDAMRLSLAAIPRHRTTLWIFPVGLLLAGCAHFEDRPIAPAAATDAFEARSLADPNLEAFLGANHALGAPQAGTWDLNSLALVAFYYHPDLAVARAQWATARAAEVTAGERPNPNFSATPGYDSGIPGAPSPWILPFSLDVPIETAGKRGYRSVQASELSEAARWNLVAAIWQVRSHVRTALLNLYAADQMRALLTSQEAAQAQAVRLLEGQLSAGGISGYEVTQGRIALDTTRLAYQDALRQSVEALSQLASALGLPRQALDGVRFSYAQLDSTPGELSGTEARRQALLNRADVRAALAEYAASQSALQLEIARQYPDIHLGPGYSWNGGSAGDSQWQLGLGLTLPVLNQNQGAIGEAKAKREEAAARFQAVEAGAIAEVAGALAGYQAALQQSAVTEALSKNLRQDLDSVRAMQGAGEADPLAVANAEVQYYASAGTQLNALVRVRQALGALEDATESPMILPESTLNSAQQVPPPLL